MFKVSININKTIGELSKAGLDIKTPSCVDGFTKEKQADFYYRRGMKCQEMSEWDRFWEENESNKYTRTKLLNQAAADYKKTIEIDPAHDDAMYSLSQICFMDNSLAKVSLGIDMFGRGVAASLSKAKAKGIDDSKGDVVMKASAGP